MTPILCCYQLGEIQSTIKDWRHLPLCDGHLIEENYVQVLINQFVLKSRSILDNALAASEFINSMKSKTKGKTSDIALKIDFNKVYYRVDRAYIHGFMQMMDFDPKWIR